MMRSARSGTTSQAIFSMMSRDTREIREASWSSNSRAMGGGGVVMGEGAATAGSTGSAKNSSASVGGTAKAGAASSAKTSNCSTGTVSNPAAPASTSKISNCSSGAASSPSGAIVSATKSNCSPGAPSGASAPVSSSKTKDSSV